MIGSLPVWHVVGLSAPLLLGWHVFRINRDGKKIEDQRLFFDAVSEPVCRKIVWEEGKNYTYPESNPGLHAEGLRALDWPL